MDIELNLSNAVKGAGVWSSFIIPPSAWYENSSNIAVSVASTGIGPTLTFGAAASTTDIAIARLTLPANFKRHKDTSSAKLLIELPLGNVMTSAGGDNDNLEAQLKFVFTPPIGDTETSSSITVDYLGTPISDTVGDPSGAYLKVFRFDALAGLTTAQKKLLNAGWTVDAYLRPNETVSSNVAMLVGTGFWHVKTNLDLGPTLTTLD